MSTASISPFANPFFSPAPAVDALDEGDLVEASESSDEYALVPTAPHVADDEVCGSDVVVSLTLRWGTRTVAVAHLEKARGYVLGEGGDFVVPEDMLGGASSIPLVVRSSGESLAIVPPSASVHATLLDGAVVTSLSELAERRLASPSAEGAGTFAVSLDALRDLRVTLPNDLVADLAVDRAGKRIARPFSLASAATGHVGLSFLLHAGIIASMAFFMPQMNADDAEGVDRDHLLVMRHLMNNAAEREQERLEELSQQSGAEEPGGGQQGEQHKGPEGASGKESAPDRSARAAVKGTSKEIQLARKDELELARSGGMIGILLEGAPATDGPKSPWGGDVAVGGDSESAWGHMWGETIGDAFGLGLGLSGTGEGGGCTGGDCKGIGLDRVGTIGGGRGTCDGGPCGPGDGPGGMGRGHGPRGGGHVSKGPVMRPVNVQVGGRIPEDVIQRIVRQNFGRFRNCYEGGMRTNPSLTGRVATKFIIGRDGSVNVAQDAGSDLPDHEVVSCVVRNFKSLSFPQPEGGIVTVTYPILFTPGS